MIDLRPEDISHKIQLNRVLIELIDSPLLSQNLAFKGGTAATMLGYLDRFSVDLDFDLLGKAKKPELRKEFMNVFSKLDLKVAKEFKEGLFFQVKYPGKEQRQRNTMSVSAQDISLAANEYKVQYLKEIDRLIKCQTIETMFANKLVAIIDRHDKHNAIASRDLYDIHHFFIEGYNYLGAVIKERTGLPPSEYLNKLIRFIDKHVTQAVINEDLYALLPDSQFQKIRKVLISETKHILATELKKLSHLV